jgi:plasmid stabilization system protein ParE
MVPERNRDDLREVVHGSYRVIYRIDPDKIVILTVRHSSIPILPGDIDLSD